MGFCIKLVPRGYTKFICYSINIVNTKNGFYGKFYDKIGYIEYSTVGLIIKIDKNKLSKWLLRGVIINKRLISYLLTVL